MITSQAIAFSFPIKPNFSTVLPFKLIRSLFNFNKFDNELIIFFPIF